MGNTLANLKLRLLSEALDQVADLGQHALLMREADIAFRLAARASYPELLFPCLFEERVALALQLEKLRQQRYWRTLVTSTPVPLPVVVSP